MDISESKRTRRLLGLALALATLCVYWRVVGFDFVNYDDPDYVTENPMVRAGLTGKGILWAFAHTCASNWHPLTWISLMLDSQIFGLHPGGFHVVNVMLHTANALLLFVLLHRLTGAVWRSGMVAALFALHPLHVESVAWISERKDVLSMFFGLLSLIAYTRYSEEHKSRASTPQAGAAATSRSKVYWFCGLAAFALGLMAKPMLVTLPFVMLLLDFWPLQRVENMGWRTFFSRQFGNLVREKWAWFFLSGASCAITVYAQKTGGAMMNTEQFPLLWRVGNAVTSYFVYLLKACWPARLAIYYPLDHQQSIHLFFPAAAFLLFISVAVLVTLKRYPYLLVGWLWFLGTLVPVIGLVQVGEQAMADRYTYLPYIGIFIAAVWAISELCSRSRGMQVFGATAALALLACFVTATVLQLRYWQNSLTLFAHALAVTHNNAVANNDFGSALASSGHKDEALPYYAEAVRIEPGRAEYQNNLGTALARIGQTNAAVEHYFTAIQLDSRFAKPYSNLGAILLAQHRSQEAITDLSQAVQLDPANSEFRNNLGGALLSAGRVDEALDQYAEALRLDPTNAVAHLNAGLALVKKGRSDDALNQFREAVRFDSNSGQAHYEFGRQLFLRGDFQSAREQLSLAAGLKPDDASVQFYLGIACLELGDIQSGLKNLARAEVLRPQWAAPLNAHAWVLATIDNDQIRDPAQALRLAQRAADLNERQQPAILHTLAAAYAAGGQFDKATATVQKAIQSAQSLGQTNLVLKLQQALELYQSGRPLRKATFDGNG